MTTRINTRSSQLRENNTNEEISYQESMFFMESKVREISKNHSKELIRNL